LATTCGAYTQGKWWRGEKCASGDGSGEMDVVHAGGIRGSIMVVLGIESHRKSGSWYLLNNA